MPGTSSGFICFTPGENGLTLNLARDNRGRPTVAGTYLPAVEGERQRRQDQAVTFNDFSGGMGYSRRVYKNVYAYGDPVYARSPGLVMPPGLLTSVTLPSVGSPVLGAITASAEYGGDLYFTAGPYILKAAGGTGTPVVAGHLSTNPLTRYDSLAVFNGSLYAGGMVPPNIAGLAKFNGTTWTVSSTVLRRFLASVYWIDSDGVGAFRLIGTDGDSSFRYVADDPMVAANWTPGPASPAIQVGNTSYAINSVAASNRHVYFVKQNGVHDVDGRGYAPNLTPYWEHSYDPDNGNVSLVHNAKVFASHFQGLDMVDVSSALRQDEPTWIHPGAIVPNETPIFGPVVALANEAGWLAAVFYNGSSSYLLYGMQRRQGSTSSDLGEALKDLAAGGPNWIWQGSEATIRGERVTHLRVTSLDGNPRLWIASLSGTTPKLRWLSLPKASSPLQDYLNGGPWRPAESFSLYLPAEDWGASLASKTLLQYSLRADQLGHSFLELFAAIDAGSYLREGISSRSPIEVMDGSGLVTGFDVALRVDGTTRNSTPPLLRALEARASVHLKPVRVKAYTVVVSDHLTLRSGATDDADAKEIWDRLQKLQTAGPVEFVDEWGERYLAEVQEGIDSATVAHANGDGWSETATVRVTFLNRISRWDDGSRYGGRMVWSRDAGPITLSLELTGGGILLRWRLLNAPLSPWPPVTIIRKVPGGVFVPGTPLPGNDFEWLDEEATAAGLGPGTYSYTAQLPDGRTSETLSVTVPSTPSVEPAAFSVQIVKERVLNAGATAYIDIFTIYCRNTTVGTWTSYAWTAAGTGVAEATGADPDFLTAFTTLTGASIVLTLDDGLDTERTLAVTDLEAAAPDGIQAEPLGIAETTAAGSFDGTNYRSDAASAGNVTQTGGPGAFGGSTGIAQRTADYLATSADENSPFGAVAITADWMELDISAVARVVGANDGRIAVSSDSGANWTVKTGPSGDPVLRVIKSRFTAGQIWVLTAGAIYRSDDDGDTWATVRSAGDDQVFTDLVLAHTRNVVVGYDTVTGLATMERAEDGTVFTHPATSPVLDRFNAVQADIHEDKFYAYDDTVPPRTVYTLESGGYALGLGTTMPASVTAAPARGMDHTMLPGELLGGGGDVAWKWLKFGGSLAGFYLLRKASIAGAGVGPFVQVRHGALAEPPALALALTIINTSEADGLFVRPSSGAWFRPTGIEPPFRSERIFTAAIAPDNHSRMYAVDGNSNPRRFWTSSDGGANWTQPAAPPAWSNRADQIVCPAEGEVYAASSTNSGGATSRGIWRTTDGGVNWVRIISDPAIDCVDYSSNKIFFSRSNAVTHAEHFWYANRDGSSPTSWATPSGGVTQTHIRAFSDALAVGLANFTGIYKLVPGSAAVEITPAGTGQPSIYQYWDIEIIDANTYLALITDGANTDKIYRTIDGGTNWSVVYTFPLSQGPTATGSIDYHHLAALRSNRQIVAAHGRSSTSHQQDILISSDGGATWSVEKNTADESDGAGGFIMNDPGSLVVP